MDFEDSKDEGEKQVKEWKKAAAGVIAIVVILQCAVLYVVAANTGVARRSDDRSTVLIDLFKNDGTTSDFVNEFPENLFLSELSTEPAAKSAAREVYDEIPGFVQEEYGHALYGQGTVASHGSSITALAMTATYLTGYQYLPDELARSFAGKADTDVDRILCAADALGLVYENADKWEDIFNALQEGKCAILQLAEKSMFAEGGHFIVLKGVTEDGRVLVNDPCGANHLKEALKEGFASGFDENVVSGALRWGIIFDRSAIPEDIKRYEESAGETTGERYAALGLSYTEKQLLARAVCVLGEGECAEGQQALAEVLLNRLLSEGFPNELKELVCGTDALCDLDLLNAAEVTEAEYGAVTKAIYGPYLLNENVTDFSYACHK